MKREVFKEPVKKIIFKETLQRYIDFRLKLSYDDLIPSTFLRLCIRAYLDNDPSIRTLVESVQKSKIIKKVRQKEMAKEKEINDKFGLDEDEKSNIFDLLEQEHPDL